MTTISSTVVADSIGIDAPRLTTLQLRYPLVIHQELLTHRMMSKNSRSSRAVPIAKMIAEVEDDPFIPLHWGAAQKGMQAYEECFALVDQSWRDDCAPHFLDREEAWLGARDAAVNHARAFMKAGYAKQLVNRLLMPFLHIDTIVSATEWSNFFALRDHHAAEPHIQMLARAIKKAMAESEPRKLAAGEWHLPYADDQKTNDMVWDHLAEESWGPNGADADRRALETLKKLSGARCARISYAPFEGAGSIQAEIVRYDSLVQQGHWSPLEHQAMPDIYWGGRHPVPPGWHNPEAHGNLVGWSQNRRLVEAEKLRAAA